MKKLKPLNILDNKGFWSEKAAVGDAIKEIFTLGECAAPIQVRDFGRFRSPRWRDDDNNLVPWQSVDWYVYDALDEDRIQVDSARMLHNLSQEPWREEKELGDHYDLFVMEEDMFDPPADAGGKAASIYSVGRSRPLTAAVISTHRIEHIWGMPYSYIKTEVMRQLCFMFGIPGAERDDVLKGEDGGLYCKNVCILRPARVAPDDWEGLTCDRIRHGGLCQSCIRDLKGFFSEAAQEAK